MTIFRTTTAFACIFAAALSAVFAPPATAQGSRAEISAVEETLVGYTYRFNESFQRTYIFYAESPRRGYGAFNKKMNWGEEDVDVAFRGVSWHIKYRFSEKRYDMCVKLTRVTSCTPVKSIGKYRMFKGDRLNLKGRKATPEIKAAFPCATTNGCKGRQG